MNILLFWKVHIDKDNARKMTKFNFQKKWQKYSEDYIQTTCISSDHDQNTSEVSKELV